MPNDWDARSYERRNIYHLRYSKKDEVPSDSYDPNFKVSDAIEIPNLGAVCSFD